MMFRTECSLQTCSRSLHGSVHGNQDSFWVAWVTNWFQHTGETLHRLNQYFVWLNFSMTHFGKTDPWPTSASNVIGISQCETWNKCYERELSLSSLSECIPRPHWRLPVTTLFMGGGSPPFFALMRLVAANTDWQNATEATKQMLWMRTY